jgi:YidC/Oxa1 family membrane protein insertase
VLLDLLGADQLSRTISTLAPAIPVWDQYVDLVEWILTQLGGFLNSGGLAIIAFTILVKTLLLPLTIKSTRSTKAMQELAPKIKEIQKKHGADRQAASAEQMALYQQYGVNPMAGCLPMLIQMPIFFGVYFGIRDMSSSGLSGWGEGFLWLPDLSDPDPWHILPVLAGIFQFVQTRMMRPANQKITDPQQQMMNTMMTFLPLSVVIFGWGFASGPVLYWVVQAMYSVVQQWMIGGWGAIGEWFPWLPELPEHRRLGYQAPRAIDDVVVVSGQKPEPTGRFAKWMHAQQEKAAEMQRQQQAQAKQAKSAPSASTAAAQKSSRKRADYQARVDAAARYKGAAGNGAAARAAGKNGSGASGDDAVVETTATAVKPASRPKKKQRRRT